MLWGSSSTTLLPFSLKTDHYFKGMNSSNTQKIWQSWMVVREMIQKQFLKRQTTNWQEFHLNMDFIFPSSPHWVLYIVSTLWNSQVGTIHSTNSLTRSQTCTVLLIKHAFSIQKWNIFKYINIRQGFQSQTLKNAICSNSYKVDHSDRNKQFLSSHTEIKCNMPIEISRVLELVESAENPASRINMYCTCPKLQCRSSPVILPIPSHWMLH